MISKGTKFGLSKAAEAVPSCCPICFLSFGTRLNFLLQHFRTVIIEKTVALLNGNGKDPIAILLYLGRSLISKAADDEKTRMDGGNFSSYLDLQGSDFLLFLPVTFSQNKLKRRKKLNTAAAHNKVHQAS